MLNITEAKNIQDARELLKSGKHNKIKLAFDVNADDFFGLIGEWSDKSLKVKKLGEFFSVSISNSEKT